MRVPTVDMLKIEKNYGHVKYVYYKHVGFRREMCETIEDFYIEYLCNQKKELPETLMEKLLMINGNMIIVGLSQTKRRFG